MGGWFQLALGLLEEFILKIYLFFYSKEKDMFHLLGHFPRRRQRLDCEASGFLQVSRMSAGMSSAAFPGHTLRAGLGVKQLGHKPVLVWDAGTAGQGLGHYTVVVALRFSFYF